MDELQQEVEPIEMYRNPVESCSSKDCTNKSLYHYRGKPYCRDCFHPMYNANNPYKSNPGERAFWRKLARMDNNGNTGERTKPRGARNQGIGALARRCIMKGMDYEATRAEVLKLVPTSKFSKACFSWYKGKVTKK